MCMNISKEDLLRINSGFGGNLRSASSLDYALDMLNSKKLGYYKKLAYLMRAILVYHPFTDGNKRTAAFLALAFAEENHKQIDLDMLIYHITSIAIHNITDIKNIDWRLKTCIK